MNSHSNFTEICSHESNWQKDNISSGKGLAPNKRKVITWTNDDPVYWRICAALRGDELNPSVIYLFSYNYQNTGYLLNITYIFYKCHCSLVEETPNKRDSKKLTYVCKTEISVNGGIDERGFSNP